MRTHGRLLGVVFVAVTTTITMAHPTAAQERDHLKCYRIKDGSTVAPAVARLENQLDVESNCKVTARARLLCEETTVDDADDTRGGPANRFLCYRLSCKIDTPPVKGRQLDVSDRATPGGRTVTLEREEMLCTPFTIVDPEPPSCTSNDDCAPDAYCMMPLGACSAGGTCSSRPSICLQYFDPVCGCDGQTHSNECFAASRGVSIAHRGPCP